MFNSKNTIKQSEISITPVKVKYASTYYSDGSIDTPRPFLETGLIISNAIQNLDILPAYYNNTDDPGASIDSQYYVKALYYRLVRQLYYQNYATGSYLQSSSYWDFNPQSTACSGSPEYENRYFPLNTTTVVGNSQGWVISIPPSIFGEQISKNTFSIKPESSTNYNIVDDGNGNLIDTENNNAHVGNIIYSQGIAVITNEDYLLIFQN